MRKYKIVYSVPGERNAWTICEEKPNHRNYEEAVIRIARNIHTYMNRYVEIYLLDRAGNWQLVKIFNHL
jgi:hypothetical protein